MMKKLLLIIALFIAQSYVQAQTPVWIWATGSAGGTSNNAATHFVRDQGGNSYVTSDFSGTRSFGSGAMTAYGQNDIFVSKYDPNGGITWSTHFGSASTFSNNGGIAIDAGGNIYVAGSFGYNLFVDNNNIFTTAGLNDIALIKLDPAGNVIWAKHFGGTGDDIPFSVVSNGSDIFMVGSHNGAFAADAVNFAAPSGGQDNIFISKFDTSGTCLWGTSIGGSSGDRALCAAVTNTNLYVAGYFQGTAMFGSTSLTSGGGNDIFIAKFDLSGTQLWAKKAGSISTDQANSIGVDAFGNAYITGMFYGTVNFGLTPGGSPNNLSENPIGYGDAFVARYNSADGTCAWARRIHSGSNDQGIAISTNNFGGSFVTGFYGGNATIQTGATTSTSFTSASGNDCFILKYDLNGSMLWGIHAGGSQDDRGKGILYDANGFCTVSGYFGGTVAFGAAGSLTASAGLYSMFYGRINGFSAGLQVINKELNMTVYPNPATDKIHVSVSDNESINAIELYDLQGQVVRSTPMISTGNDATFDVSGIAAGTYVVSAISKNGIGTKTIQVQ